MLATAQSDRPSDQPRPRRQTGGVHQKESSIRSGDGAPPEREVEVERGKGGEGRAGS